jgi:hypothetical protein
LLGGNRKGLADRKSGRLLLVWLFANGKRYTDEKREVVRRGGNLWNGPSNKKDMRMEQRDGGLVGLSHFSAPVLPPVAQARD